MVIAFCATEGGSAGAIAGAAVGVATRPPGAADGAGGLKVVVWPAGFVIVTMFVVLLISTLLWMLAKITLLGGGAT
jgi:hypothetical protein